MHFTLQHFLAIQTFLALATLASAGGIVEERVVERKIVPHYRECATPVECPMRYEANVSPCNAETFEKDKMMKEGKGHKMTKAEEFECVKRLGMMKQRRVRQEEMMMPRDGMMMRKEMMPREREEMMMRREREEMVTPREREEMIRRQRIVPEKFQKREATMEPRQDACEQMMRMHEECERSVSRRRQRMTEREE